ncbi:hypothetical protein Rhal01_00309 [Rubritalea halochordaticola]|uniref:Uncharacterized protein n=1 Tax=Rubritalea halochordaticola TaxID=714537 RepID=A0ABP9UZ91_9BACT
MADEKPTPSTESEDESFWDIDSQGVDDIISEASEPSSSSTHAPQAEVAESTSPQPKAAAAQAPASQPSKPKTPTSAVERIFQVTVFLILIATGYWFFGQISTQFDTSDQREYSANTPATGNFASIDHIDSWWQEPASAFSREENALVPAAEIHLDPSSSKSGTLRIVFYSMEKNSDGTPKSAGDSITVNFTDGKFSNGTSSYTAIGTAGLSLMGDFYAYRNQDETRWTVEVREAPAGTQSNKDFKDLAKAPISATVKEPTK